MWARLICSETNDSGARQRTAEQIARTLEIALEVAANVTRDALVGLAESNGAGKRGHRSFHRAPVRRIFRAGASRARERAAESAFFRDVLVAQPLEPRDGGAQIFYLGRIVRRRRLEHRRRVREHSYRRHRLP